MSAVDPYTYDVIVIGSGPGGCTCATLLQKRGFRTLLVEKNGVVGGKMVSVKKDGFAYDLFPHGQVPMRRPAFEEVFRELGVSDEFRPALLPDDTRDVLRIAYRGRGWTRYRRTSQGQAMTDPTPFFRLWGIDEEEQRKAVALMTEIATLTSDQLDELDDVTMHEFLSSRDCPDALYSYMAFHANASLAEPIDLVAASEQILILQQIMLDGGGGQYAGGFGVLAEIMVREFEKNGGTLLRDTKVERIIVEQGVATGVETSKGAYRAGVVVSSAGIQPTVLKLVGESQFDRAYVTRVKSLVPGWGFTSIRYFLDAPVLDVPMYVAYSDDSWWNQERYERVVAGAMPDEVILFMCNHSFYDEGAAPIGKQVLVSGTICSPDPEAREIEALWSRMEAQLAICFPEIPPAVGRREYAGPRDISRLTRDSVLPGQGGECVGLGQIAGQCGKLKPSPVAPIQGLYYVGADAGGAGMGTHQAASSGIAVANMIDDFLDDRRLAG